MEKSDLVNIFSVIKKGLYDYDVGYFDENSLSVIDKNEDEVMALEKMRNIVGGGYLDTLNEYCDMYVEMKGGVKFIDKNLAKWKLKMTGNKTVTSIKSTGKVLANYKTKFGERVDERNKISNLKRIDTKLMNDIKYEIDPMISKVTKIIEKIKTFKNKCKDDKCLDITNQKIAELKIALDATKTSLEQSKKSIKSIDDSVTKSKLLQK